MKYQLVIPLFLLSIISLFACTPDSDTYGEQDYSETSFMQTSNNASGGLVRMTDPKEGAFSIMMPQGWKSQVSLERPHGQIRTCGVATSPDGATRIFFGDPNLPSFLSPNPQFGMFEGMQTGNPLQQVRRFMQAEQFFPGYVKQYYGQLPGFRLTGTQSNPDLQQHLEKKAREYGLQPYITTTTVSFEFSENGQTIKAAIHGATLGMQEVWLADVNGYMTSGDPQKADQLIREVVVSHQTNPQWQQRENMRNQQKMRQSQIAHQQRMQANQQRFQAHQNMMQQRYNAADAQHQNWMQNQAIQDQQHDQFIDYIRDQETVTNGTQTGKVDAGYNNYYVDPNTGNYIGTNSYENPDVSVYEHWRRKY